MGSELGSRKQGMGSGHGLRALKLCMGSGLGSMNGFRASVECIV